ncbi:lysoplasmalogenase [Psychroserpens sp. XS_ASV72]|uniref:lysoplasmalogenase n=1 Tax=Psychroserpens sp. XS_ASV72 TaxID=3241293 RepID=UPI0035120CFA
MLSKSELKFSVAYFLIVAGHLICGLVTELIDFTYITKPAIVSSLLMFFLAQSKDLGKSMRLLMILALLFSLFGDISLMFDNLSSSYFIIGLVSFLLAHIMYILVFLKHRNTSSRPLGFLGLLLLYAISLFFYLKDGLGDMLVPVMVYMIVILGMATSAFLRRKSVNTKSFTWVLIGAILFLVSDSILAIDKFHHALPLSSVSIMLSYALAQYCIVIGILKLKPELR